MPPTSTPSAAPPPGSGAPWSTTGPAVEDRPGASPRRWPGSSSPRPATPAACRVATPSRDANAWCRAVTSEKPARSFGAAPAQRVPVEQVERAAGCRSRRGRSTPPRTSGSVHARRQPVGPVLVGAGEPRQSGRRRPVDAHLEPPDAQHRDARLSSRAGSTGPAGATTATRSPGRSRGGRSSTRPGRRGRERRALGPAQPRRGQPGDQLAGGDRRGPGVDGTRVPLGGQVVVVPVEAALRDPEPAGEGVQLVERLVAGDVRPEPAVAVRLRRVDEDGQGERLTSPRARPGRRRTADRRPVRGR